MTPTDTTRHVQPYPSPVHKKKPILRTHKRAFLLLFFYIPLVVIPWIITMIMVYRPLTRPSWVRVQGFWQKDYKIMRGWATAIPIMNAFAAIIAITVTSAVVAQAAVVFAQRRHSGQQLNVKHLLGLADRVWIDLGALPHNVAQGKTSLRCFLLGAAALIILGEYGWTWFDTCADEAGAVQYPLIQILVSWKEINISNCRSTGFIQDAHYDNFRCDVSEYRNSYHGLGQDLEPAQLAVISAYQVMPRIKNDLAQYTRSTELKNLWQDVFKYGHRLTANMDIIDREHFVAVLPANSTTGVLRQHLMRMNSNVTCTNLTLAEFPSTCTGTNPFQASWDYLNRGTYYNGTLEICAPGDQGKHPWTLSRNRQDITEELFFKYRETYHSMRDDETLVEEEVFHCTSQTTRGYFELGNVYNGGRYGPLLEKWPSDGSPEQASQYNDFFEVEWGPGVGVTPGYFPSEEDHGQGYASAIPDPIGVYDYYAPKVYTNVTGPLMTSVLALFGPDSWTGAVLNLTTGKSKDELENSHTDQTVLLEPICHLVPYRRGGVSSYSGYRESTCKSSLWGLRSTLDDFLAEWSTMTYLEDKLRASMFYANRALLTANAEDNYIWEPWAGRGIYTAPGWTVLRPHISLAAQIILSLIIALHVLGLLALAFFIYRYPAWTRTLDALAVARVAANLDPTLLPPIRAATHKDSAPLAAIDGLIGVHDNDNVTPIPHRRHRTAESGVLTDRDIEMEALSVASTAGKEPASSATPTPAYDESLSLGLGAPGVLPRGVKTANSPPVPPPVPRGMQE
ncbi:hypothetical protein SVAN01_09001 [Stagonosporopsis vannaccii]|nr:hypothetical protein SVAN01_09001 [Stagonosporopsis vannaccii]